MLFTSKSKFCFGCCHVNDIKLSKQFISNPLWHINKAPVVKQQSTVDITYYLDFPNYDEDLIKYFIQAVTHIAWKRINAFKTGCRIVHIALPTMWRPIVPPGRKLTKYHINATSWTPSIAEIDGDKASTWCDNEERKKRELESKMKRAIRIRIVIIRVCFVPSGTHQKLSEHKRILSFLLSCMWDTASPSYFLDILW